MITNWIKRIGGILIVVGVLAGAVGALPLMSPVGSAGDAPPDVRLLIAGGAAVGLGLVLIAVAMFGGAMFGPTGYED